MSTISDAGHGHVLPLHVGAHHQPFGAVVCQQRRRRRLRRCEVDGDCYGSNIHIPSLGKVTNVDPVLVSKQVSLLERFKQAPLTKRCTGFCLNVHPLALLTSLSAAASGVVTLPTHHITINGVKCSSQ